MKLTTLDAEACRAIRGRLPEINAVLAPLGVAATMGNMTYTGEKATAAMEFILSDGDAVAAIAAAKEKEFRLAATMFGLQPDDFGKVFTSRGTRYRVAGLVGGRSTKISIARLPDGKMFNADSDSVKAGLLLAAQ